MNHTKKLTVVKPDSSPRAFAPKPTLGVVPALVTDQTAFAVVGLTPGQFREVVKRYAIPSRKIGSRLIVAVSDLLAFVQSVGAVDPATPAPADAHEQPETVDEVLAVIGRRRTA